MDMANHGYLILTFEQDNWIRGTTRLRTNQFLSRNIFRHPEGRTLFHNAIYLSEYFIN